MSQLPTLGQHEPSPHAAQLGWRGTLAVVLAVLIVYVGTTRLTGRTTTPQVAYFDHLAAAFLDGQLYLEDPPGDSDLTRYNDRWYVPFPPLAAVLMLPWVAAFGIEGTAADHVTIAHDAAERVVVPASGVGGHDIEV